MLFLDLCPGRVVVGEVSDKANWNFVLDALAVVLANRTKEQHPSFTLPTSFFLYPTSLMFAHHLYFSLKQVKMPDEGSFRWRHRN
jgi:hypothetical protein